MNFDKYDFLHQTRYLFLLKEIEKLLISLLEKQNKIVLVDIGSGTGQFLSLLKNKFKRERIKIYALDRINSLNDKTITFIKINDLNKDRIDLPNEFADVITCSEAIEHLYQPDNLILESRRILRKQGYFVITTPNLNSWINRILILFGYFPYGMSLCRRADELGVRDLKYIKQPSKNLEKVNYDYHIRLYGVKALTKILSLYKFKIVKISSFVRYYPNDKFYKRLINSIYYLLNKINPFLSQIIFIICKK